MDTKIYLTMLAVIATIGGLFLFVLLAAPIAEPLAWALIIGVATYPYYDRLLQRFPRHPGGAAGLMVLATIVCFLLPIVGLVVTIAQNAPQWFSQAEGLVQGVARSGGTLLDRIPFARELKGMGERAGIDVGGHAARMAGSISVVVLDAAKNMAKGLAELLFILAVALFILFFIYRDGKRVVVASIKCFSNDKNITRLAGDLRATTTAVVVGTVFTCLIQGFSAGAGYFVAGAPAPVLFGALTAFAALIPVVGTGVVWVPLCAYLAIKGTYLTAALLAAWCMVAVGLADNAIRPLVVGAQRDVPALPVVLGAICGVSTIGLLGLILGPVAFATVITIWHEITGRPPAGGEDEGLSPE